MLVNFGETYSACLESESVKKNKYFKEDMVFTRGKDVKKKKKKSQWISYLQPYIPHWDQEK